jgi:hypothetical protein
MASSVLCRQLSPFETATDFFDLSYVEMARTRVWWAAGVAPRPGSPKSSCAPALRRENASIEWRIPGVLGQRSAGRLGGRVRPLMVLDG